MYHKKWNNNQHTCSFNLVLREFKWASLFSWDSSILASKFSFVFVTKVETISCLFCTAWLIFSSTSLMDRLAWKMTKRLNDFDKMIDFLLHTSRLSLAANSFLSISSSEGCGRVGVETVRGEGGRSLTGSARITYLTMNHERKHTSVKVGREFTS